MISQKGEGEWRYNARRKPAERGAGDQGKELSMKTIGKIAALAMTLSLMFVLTACGGSSSSSAASSSEASDAASSAAASSESASASAESASAESASEESASADAAAEASEESASAEASEEASADASESESIAAADADVYENEFFGIKYRLPEGWKFVDVNEIGGVNDVISTASQNAQLDMVAMNEDQNQIVVIGIEEPEDSNAGKTAEEYLQAQVEQTQAALEGNYSYTASDATVTFNGMDRELPAYITNLDINGVQFSICQAVAEKEGYFFNAIAMGANQDEVVSAFSSFVAMSE
jgi:hypothetical protein